nr:hypothetical protein [uncultured Roseovarius sp.]
MTPIYAANIRLAGYLIENQLRVAQVLSAAVLESNPFALPTRLRMQAAKPAVTTAEATPL